jgi:hypothetical protein
MDFRPLSPTEHASLAEALRRNAGDGAALLMDRRDTSFLGTSEEVPDAEVISAIKSVPCHYAGRYLLNSAVITAPGDYRYTLIDVDAAKEWAAQGFVSSIGYAQTAQALTELLGTPVAEDRRTIAMAPGDQALVFRLVFPPGSPRIEPGDKGRLSAALMAGHYELGLLERIAPPPNPEA